MIAINNTENSCAVVPWVPEVYPVRAVSTPSPTYQPSISYPVMSSPLKDIVLEYGIFVVNVPSPKERTPAKSFIIKLEIFKNKKASCGA